MRTDATAASIVEFEKEIQNYAEAGITESELLFTRNAIGQRDARSFETPSQKIGLLTQILDHDLDVSFVTEQSEILSAISPDEINALAAKHMNLDEMLVVVVGDKQAILPGLQETRLRHCRT